MNDGIAGTSSFGSLGGLSSMMGFSMLPRIKRKVPDRPKQIGVDEVDEEPKNKEPRLDGPIDPHECFSYVILTFCQKV